MGHVRKAVKETLVGCRQCPEFGVMVRGSPDWKFLSCYVLDCLASARWLFICLKSWGRICTPDIFSHSYRLQPCADIYFALKLKCGGDREKRTGPVGVRVSWHPPIQASMSGRSKASPTIRQREAVNSGDRCWEVAARFWKRERSAFICGGKNRPIVSNEGRFNYQPRCIFIHKKGGRSISPQLRNMA